MNESMRNKIETGRIFSIPRNFTNHCYRFLPYKGVSIICLINSSFNTNINNKNNNQ